MFSELAAKTLLPDLQAANLPRMTAERLGVKAKDGVELDQPTLEFLEDVDKYLSVFSAPKERDGASGEGFVLSRECCIACGSALGGMLGSFQWGLAHGEGNCSCGYPARAIHYIKDRHGKDCFTRPLQLILQYHPSQLETTPPL